MTADLPQSGRPQRIDTVKARGSPLQQRSSEGGSAFAVSSSANHLSATTPASRAAAQLAKAHGERSRSAIRGAVPNP